MARIPKDWQEVIREYFSDEPKEVVRLLLSEARHLRNTEGKESENAWARVVDALENTMRELRLLY